MAGEGSEDSGTIRRRHAVLWRCAWKRRNTLSRVRVCGGRFSGNSVQRHKNRLNRKWQSKFHFGRKVMNNIISVVKSANGVFVSLASWLQSPLLLAIRLYWGWQFA